MRSLLLFAHERTDARVGRRAAMFASEGWRVTGLTFHRERSGRGGEVAFENIHLGHTRDRAYLQRVLALVQAFRVLWRERARVSGADALYAINTDNAVLALAARWLCHGRPPLVVEIADIQPPFLSPGPGGRLLRWIERRVLARAACLVTTSLGFDRHYFTPVQRFAGTLFLLENKVFPSNGLAARRRPPPEPGPPWRIGWFGAFRCRRSWEIIKSIAGAHPGLVEFVLRGYPTAIDPDTFLREAAAHPNIHFGGPYNYPRDLPDLHAGLHFVWAFDFSDAGANSRWLLPNRLYESGLFHVPVLSEAGSETGRWVETRGVGAALDADGLEARLAGFLGSLAPEAWRRRQQAAAGRPDDDFTGEADAAKLCRLIDVAAAENRARESTPDRTYA